MNSPTNRLPYYDFLRGLAACFGDGVRPTVIFFHFYLSFCCIIINYYFVNVEKKLMSKFDKVLFGV